MWAGSKAEAGTLNRSHLDNHIASHLSRWADLVRGGGPGIARLCRDGTHSKTCAHMRAEGSKEQDMPLPVWITSQLHANGICEICAGTSAATTWAGTGQDICRNCCEKKRQANM